MKIFLKKIPATPDRPAALIGGTQEDQQVINQMENGKDFSTNLKTARNIWHHRKLFAMFKTILENLPENSTWEAHGELFSTANPMAVVEALGLDLAGRVIFIKKTEDILDLCKFELGHFERKALPNNQVSLKLKSISFENMGQEKFNEFFNGAVNTCLKYLIKIDDPQQRAAFEEHIAINF